MVGRSSVLNLSYIGSIDDTANAASYTFPSVSLGDAAADREIIVVAYSRTTANGSTPTMTIGDESATHINGGFEANSVTTTIDAFRATVPNGANGDIVLTYSNSMLRAAISIYRATGINSITSKVVTGVTENPTNQDITPPNGELAIAAGVIPSSSGTSIDLSGVTEDIESSTEAITWASGHGALYGSVEFSGVTTGTPGFRQWASIGIGIG